MRDRTNRLVAAVFANSLAAAVALGPAWAAAADSGCSERPHEINQPGHWYYYVDRVHHRRCWFFEPSGAMTGPQSSPERVLAPNPDPEPTLLSRFAAGVTESLYGQPTQSVPQQNMAPVDNASTTLPKTDSPKHSRATRIARRERSQIMPAPETNGIASADRHDRSAPQPTAEKDDNTPQLTAADRETLFENFLKWYTDRSLFGRP
jgi:hypothetical protein